MKPCKPLADRQDMTDWTGTDEMWHMRALHQAARTGCMRCTALAPSPQKAPSKALRRAAPQPYPSASSASSSQRSVRASMTSSATASCSPSRAAAA